MRQLRFLTGIPRTYSYNKNPQAAQFLKFI
jgi:hypothetical protein